MAWDSPLSALEQVVTACAQLDELAAAGADTGMRVDTLVVAMPLELQTRVDELGEVELAVAPPRQAIATTVMPVLHHLRLSVEVSR
jgi:hypothetical protein